MDLQDSLRSIYINCNLVWSGIASIYLLIQAIALLKAIYQFIFKRKNANNNHHCWIDKVDKAMLSQDSFATLRILKLNYRTDSTSIEQGYDPGCLEGVVEGQSWKIFCYIKKEWNLRKYNVFSVYALCFKYIYRNADY